MKIGLSLDKGINLSIVETVAKFANINGASKTLLTKENTERNGEQHISNREEIMLKPLDKRINWKFFAITLAMSSSHFVLVAKRIGLSSSHLTISKITAIKRLFPIERLSIFTSLNKPFQRAIKFFVGIAMKQRRTTDTAHTKHINIPRGENSEADRMSRMAYETWMLANGRKPLYGKRQNVYKGRKQRGVL
jgi:hypothetical protein